MPTMIRPNNIGDGLPTLPHFEEGVTLATEGLVESNLGAITNPCPNFLGSGLDDFEKFQIVDLLSAYIECFAWSYEEMSGLSLEAALHRLVVMTNMKDVKQAKQKF